MTLLYLVRHGETELNTKGVYYGWTDCALSDHGVEQGTKVAAMLKDVNFDKVISSPLQRARKTAELVSGLSGEKVRLDDRLKELNFGFWEGKHYQTIQADDQENWELWVNDWKKAAPPAGESFLTMYHRVKEALNEILENSAGQNVLLVTHQGCLRIIMCLLLQMPYESYWRFTFAHDAYSLMEIEQGYGIVKKINQRIEEEEGRGL
ncbi:alpha-ribazole phosphatase [Dehalobacterium formicoaceticum]|uniref:alpha-ribazole phosphatase n=1 Tax=Dehalobacterium formicoaceticum TaxID=51515 RepID=UPI0031F69DA2